MDLIAQAIARREKLKAELERLDAFLAVAYELQGGPPPSVVRMENWVAEPVRRQVSKRAPSGVGAETARTAAKIVSEAGVPMSTRDLVPLVEAHGIEIGGKDKIATLSARLGNDAKRDGGALVLLAGKWHLPEWISNADNKETANNPGKDASAVSLFYSNKENDAMPPP